MLRCHNKYHLHTHPHFPTGDELRPVPKYKANNSRWRQRANPKNMASISTIFMSFFLHENDSADKRR